MSEAVVREGTSIFLAVISLLALVFLIFKRFKAAASFQSLPPGPPTLPLLGNVHQLGKKTHIALTEFAKTYGPLISVKLGLQHLIIGSSPAAATEILKTYDRILSATVAFTTVVNTLSNLILSRNLIGLNGDGDDMKGEMMGLLRTATEVASAPNISDVYPVLAGLDIQGIRHKSTKLFKKICAMWEPIIKEKRDRKGNENVVSQERDFLDALIEDDFTTDQINQLFMELFSAGTDTSTATIEWWRAELIRNPKSMTTLQEEIAREIKQDVLKESELSHLPYLQACLKEVLRLHPQAPLLLPHCATEACQVMNYTIPRNTQLMVNVWAIGRDPAIWDDPTVFKPERFLNSEVDFRGNDFELLPFSSGRRICPDLPYSAKQVPLVVASLMHFFDWSLPQGNNPDKVDISEKFGIVLQKEKPLLLIPRAKI